jgi:hypothetical protein
MDPDLINKLGVIGGVSGHPSLWYLAAGRLAQLGTKEVLFVPTLHGVCFCATTHEGRKGHLYLDANGMIIPDDGPPTAGSDYYIRDVQHLLKEVKAGVWALA